MSLATYTAKTWVDYADTPCLEALELNRIDSGIAAVTAEVLSLEALLPSTYQPISSELSALAGISSTGYAKRSGAAAWSVVASIPQADVTGLTAVLAGLQPLDSDLTAIAALTTTSFGRSLLTVADAAAARTAIGAQVAGSYCAFTTVTAAADFNALASTVGYTGIVNTFGSSYANAPAGLAGGGGGGTLYVGYGANAGSWQTQLFVNGQDDKLQFRTQHNTAWSGGWHTVWHDGNLTGTRNEHDHAGAYYSAAASRTANYVLAAPNGSAGVAAFRALVWADIASGHPSVTAGTGLTGGGALTGSVTLSVSYGTAAGTAAQGNDSRIINGQTAYGWGNHALAGYALASAIPAASSTTPAALGTAAVGTGTTWARADHAHAMPTATQVGALPLTAGSGSPLSGILYSSASLNLNSATRPGWSGAQSVASMLGGTGSIVSAAYSGGTALTLGVNSYFDGTNYRAIESKTGSGYPMLLQMEVSGGVSLYVSSVDPVAGSAWTPTNVWSVDRTGKMTASARPVWGGYTPWDSGNLTGDQAGHFHSADRQWSNLASNPFAGYTPSSFLSAAAGGTPVFQYLDVGGGSSSVARIGRPGNTTGWGITVAGKSLISYDSGNIGFGDSTVPMYLSGSSTYVSGGIYASSGNINAGSGILLGSGLDLGHNYAIVGQLTADRIAVSGKFELSISSPTSLYTLSDSDCGKIVNMDAASVRMPNAGLSAGFWCVLVGGSASGWNVACVTTTQAFYYRGASVSAPQAHKGAAVVAWSGTAWCVG